MLSRPSMSSKGREGINWVELVSVDLLEGSRSMLFEDGDSSG